MSAGAVGETMRRAKAVGVTSWAAVEDLAPSALEARLYPSTAALAKAVPDCVWIHQERRRVGVTLELLHHEYLEREPNGYQYSQFCEHYRRWLRQRGVTMRQVHRAGDSPQCGLLSLRRAKPAGLNGLVAPPPVRR